jgi:antitoxin ParD1/3/4
MHISLTPQLESIIEGKIESGLYNNASEVIREALRRMEQNEAFMYQIKLEALRYAVMEGVQQAEQGKVSDYSLDGILKKAKENK